MKLKKMELNLEQFNPKAAELRALVEVTKKITDIDIDNPDDMKVVRENRIIFRDIRNAIKNTGKAMREDALKYQKLVIRKEKELIEIIEPEEERLKNIEEEAKEKKLRKERFAILPQRRERLAAIGDSLEVSDEEIIAMDETQFQGYCNKRVADKNEADRIENERKANELKAEQERHKQEKEREEAIENARKEEREREERERKEREEREREREERERQRLLNNQNYQAFLKENGYDGSDEFYLVRAGTEIRLYKKVAIYNDGSNH